MRDEVHGTTRSGRLAKSEAAKYRKLRQAIEQALRPAKPSPEKVAIAKQRAMRQAKGIRLSELAERSGMTRGNLVRLESEKNATLRTLQRYADRLGCQLEINLVTADGKNNARRNAAV